MKLVVLRGCCQEGWAGKFVRVACVVPRGPQPRLYCDSGRHSGTSNRGLHVWFWWSYMEAVDRDACDKFVTHESPRKILGGEAGRGWIQSWPSAKSEEPGGLQTQVWRKCIPAPSLCLMSQVLIIRM